MEPSSALIASRLESVSSSFAPDEIAFLALTSKIERPIVDRLSFALFSELQFPEWLVAREWPIPGYGRVDLAILKQGVPHTMLEAKAMASFDCTRDGEKQSEYPKLLQADLDRLAGALLPDTQVFSLLIATHPLDPLLSESHGVLKYVGGFNGALRRYAGAKRVREVCEENLMKYLREALPSVAGTISGGAAFGTRVELLWWLFGPFTKRAGLHILRSAV
jgi:hypothetical protein